LNQAPARASILYCDHAGGLAPILRTLSVGVILDSGQVYVGHAYNDGMDEARRHRVPVEVARYGDQLSFDENRVAILSPCTRATGGKRCEREFYRRLSTAKQVPQRRKAKARVRPDALDIL
jgi:hypothetical protein